MWTVGSPLSRLTRVFGSALSRGHVTILMYHAVVREPLAVRDWCFVEEAAFAEQIAYLTRHFEVLPLREAAARLRAGRIRRPTAVITFDDGYQNNFEVAFPILARAQAPATIFLVSDLIDTSDMVWSCRLHRALMATTCADLEWQGMRFDLQTTAARTQAAAAMKRQLKQRPGRALASELRSLVQALGDDPDRPVERDSPFRMLDRTSIREMSRSGLIEFGAHTCSHAILSLLPEDECRREIAQSVDTVAALTGQPCTTFAYPNGRTSDYTPAALDALTAAGIETAVTTMRRRNDRHTPPLELGREGVGAHTAMPEFESMAHQWRQGRAA